MAYRFAALLLALVGLTAAALAEESQQKALVIEVSDLTQEPAFVDWVQDGITMQLIALLDADGEVHLALNTCQSCGGSPYAWFEYLPDGNLQCQNCGQRFSLESVGRTQARGCNPVTLTEFVREGDTVTVPESVLQDSSLRFVNWKKF